MIRFRRKVYLDIAALFDLRQGTLSIVDNDFSVEVTTKPAYFIRDEDVFSAPGFGELDGKLFAQVLQKHGTEALKASVVTKIFKFIKHLYARYTLSNARSSVEMTVDLQINTWPFILNDNEVLDLHTLVTNQLSKKIPVEVVCFDPSKLVPEKLDDIYLAMIFYDCLDWVNSYEETHAKKKKFSTVPLFVPRKWSKNKPTGPELKQLTDKGVDPMELYERILAPCLPISFIPMAFFCVDLPANLDSYTELISG